MFVVKLENLAGERKEVGHFNNSKSADDRK